MFTAIYWPEELSVQLTVKKPEYTPPTRDEVLIAQEMTTNHTEFQNLLFLRFLVQTGRVREEFVA